MEHSRWEQRQKQFLLWVGCGLAVCGLGWAALRWVLPFLLPFLVAFGLAFLLRRPVRFLARTAGIDRRPAAGLLLCLFAALVLGALGYLTARLLVLGALLFYRKHKKFEGEQWLLYLGGYGLGRAWIEGIRTDTLFLPHTTIAVSQVLAVVLFVVALAADIFIRYYIKKHITPTAVVEKESTE